MALRAGTVAGANGNGNAAVTNAAATHCEQGQKVALTVDSAIDDYVIRVVNRPDGAVSEQDSLQLYNDIGAPELVKAPLQVKQ